MVRIGRQRKPRRRAWTPRALLLALLTLGAPAASHAQPPAPDPAVPDLTPRPATPGDWRRLRLADPVARRMATRALDLAWQRLARPDCRAVMDQFSDQAGRPLQHKLATLSVDAQTYLTMVVFIDGTRERACVSGVLAFTTPGSRVVRICVDQLKQAWQQSPDHTTANVIHEMLHTLGLGENPPAPAAITARVLSACFTSGGAAAPTGQ